MFYMRKLSFEEYQLEVKRSRLTLENKLRSTMKLFSYPESEIQATLKKAIRDLTYQSITSINAITITARMDTVLVRTLNNQNYYTEQALPIYHYDIPYPFFRLLREQAGMTFPEMADMLHVPIATYLSWEKENYIPDSWIQQIIGEIYQLVTFKRKKDGKIPSFLALPNFIYT